MIRRAAIVILVAGVALPACAVRGRTDVDVGTSPIVVVLTFEGRDLGDGMQAPVPTGWTVPDPNFPRIYRPPVNSGLDRDVTLWWVDTSCGGECRSRTSAEWDRVIRETEFAQFDDPDAFSDIRREERRPGFLLVEAENNFGVVALNIARWEDGASAYLACRASVAERDAALLDEFESACLEVAPLP